MGIFQRERWLGDLLDRILANLDEIQGRVRTTHDRPVRERARAHLEAGIRERGIALGMLCFDPEADTSVEEVGSEQRWRCMLLTRHQVELLLELAALYGYRGEPALRRLEVVELFLEMVGSGTAELERDRAMQVVHDGRLNKAIRRLQKLLLMEDDGDDGERLVDLGVSGGGGEVQVMLFHMEMEETRLLGELAMDLFERTRRRRLNRESWSSFTEQERAAIVSVLLRVMRADGDESLEERAYISSLIGQSSLDGELVGAGLEELLALVRSDGGRRFLMEQAILVSLMDGMQVVEELELLGRMADGLGFSQDELAGMTAALAEFYQRHREHLSPTPMAGALQRLYERVLKTVGQAIQLNLQRLLQEVHETRDLTELLVKAGRGKALTAEEKQRMTAQLLDICRTIPALAIFALPGGAILLPILLKVLPFNLMPSAFVEGPESPAGREE